MVYFGRAVFLAVLLLPAAQAAAEEFNCQYVWTTGKKSGVGKDAMVQINGDKARWIFSVFKDVSQPKLGMRDEVWEYKVLENNDTGVVAGHAATNTLPRPPRAPAAGPCHQPAGRVLGGVHRPGYTLLSQVSSPTARPRSRQ